VAKPKLALYWASACGGCDVALLDTNERILEVADFADIVLWPIAMDFKYHQIEEMEDDSIDICLFNGAIRDSHHEKIARLLRAKSKMMIAFGSCACFGGIPALANFSNRDRVFKLVYLEGPTNDNEQGTVPQTSTKVKEGILELPESFDTVLALPQVVPVEYLVPGCPPTVELINKVLDAVISDKLPPIGSVIASEKTLCDECPRVREGNRIVRFYRPHEIIPDPERCLLDQGIICMGPATRAGCDAKCIRANMPCRGCFGPPAGVTDQGAEMLSAIASRFEGKDEAAIANMLDQVVDPAGTLYRFGMSTSMLRRKRTSSDGAP